MLAVRDRLIVALDVATAAEARRIISALGDSVSTFKVGKQLFTAEGPTLVREIVAGGHKVFLDLKFHDIPNTVSAAVAAAGALGASMLTVHASGGSAMMKAATEAAARCAKPPLILAITVLTSFLDSDLEEIGVAGRAVDQVLRLASLARSAGCNGIVSAVSEVAALRRELGEGFAIVTPGVRPTGAAKDDQARVATPHQALAAGASLIVVGRPITAAADPAAAARAILEEMSAAESIRKV